MATATNDTVNMSFRVNRQLKKEADELFHYLGMNTSVALNMFLRQSVEEERLPFQPHKRQLPPELKEALQESDDIISGKVKAKRYDSFQDLLNDLDNDDE